MTHRYFCPDPITGTVVLLSGSEARHLRQVMRGQPGDEVILFDGSGAEFLGRICELRRDQVEVEIVRREEVRREPARQLTIAVALPKGDRQRTLVEKCTELGVAQLIPLRTVRGVAQPTERAIERLQRVVIEACKQCGRNRLMTIGPSRSLDQLVADDFPGTRLLADPTGSPWGPSPAIGSVILAAIGPEGGFDPAEIAAARAHQWQVISLGPTTLRVETAAVALAATVLIPLKA